MLCCWTDVRKREPMNPKGMSGQRSEGDIVDWKQPPKLLTLTPTYEAAEHGRYASWLFEAAFGEGCKNVALSGSYGSGKSSIVEEFVARAEESGHKVAVVSLETLLLSGHLRDSSGSGRNEGSLSEETTTQLLEREILGQLLYQGDPARTKKSSFSRLHNETTWDKFQATSAFTILFLAAIALAVFCADNRVDKIVSWSQTTKALLDGSEPTLMMLMFLGVALLYWVLSIISSLAPNGLRIKSIGAAGAAFSLGEGENSYFDKYKDELIYFFESNPFDAVVFEDIDRFDDQQIFVELRNLNQIINRSPGVKNRENQKSVCFIYAVKDSLFEELSGRDDPSIVVGSGRAKLFDQIISVIPFVSGLNAFDLALKLFDDMIQQVSEEQKSQLKELLRLAAPYVADMRLMKCVKNDYVVMSEELGLDDASRSSLGLAPVRMLAMALYKNVYPAQFEKLRLGRGELNEVCDAFYIAKSRRAESLRSSIRLCGRFGTPPQDLLNAAGSALRDSVKNVYQEGRYLLLEGTAYDLVESGRESVYSNKFWNQLANLNGDERVGISKYTSGSYDCANFTKKQFADLCSLSMEVSGFAACLDGGGAESVSALQDELETARGADFVDVLSYPYGNEKGTFRDFVLQTMTGDLATELVLGGYLGSDFDLYVSKYPLGARANSINYIRHFYQKNLMSIAFRLDANDCAELIKYIPKPHFANRCCFNTNMLSWLLGEGGHIDIATIMIDGVREHFDDGGKELLDSVYESSEPDLAFIANLTPLLVEEFEGAYDYLADVCSNYHDEDFSHTMANLALGAFDKSLEYTCAKCGKWIQDNLGSQALAQHHDSDSWNESMARFLDCCNVRVDDLTTLDSSLSRQLVERGRFEPSRCNLVFAGESDYLLPLDELMSRSQHAVDKVLVSTDAIHRYLGLLEEDEVSLRTLDEGVLHSISTSYPSWAKEKKSETINQLLSKSIIQPIENVQTDLLDPLTDNEEFIATMVKALLLGNRIEYNLSNAVAFAYAAEANAFPGSTQAFVNYLTGCSPASLEPYPSLAMEDIRTLIIQIIVNGKQHEKNVMRLASKLRVAYPQAFPVSITGIQMETSVIGENALTKLFIEDYIEPAEEVYRLLQTAPWSYREAILKKWDAGIYRSWNYRFPLLATDISRVISSDVLGGTWLQGNVREYWSDYLQKSGVSSEEGGQIIGEIERSLQEDG